MTSQMLSFQQAAGSLKILLLILVLSKCRFHTSELIDNNQQLIETDITKVAEDATPVNANLIKDSLSKINGKLIYETANKQFLHQIKQDAIQSKVNQIRAHINHVIPIFQLNSINKTMFIDKLLQFVYSDTF